MMPADNQTPLPGAEMIAAERQRQIAVEGWTANHDNEHIADEKNMPLTCAAESYIRAVRFPHLFRKGIAPTIWPWDTKFWKPASPIRMLVKAGALIAAEIDRRLRAGEKP